MALKGTLKDFAVADIFQLIGQQQKSGSLYVRTDEKEAHIVFDGGRIVLGTFKRSDEDFLLGTMLLRAGVITAEQLQQAVENQKTTLRSLGDILKSMGAVNSGILSEFVSLQLKEVLFRLFQWKDGLYEFVPEKIQYNRAIIKPQSAEAVLMDGYRMLDEWPKIQEAVGSMESVFRATGRMATPGEAGAGDDFDLKLDEAFADDAAPKAPARAEAAPSQLSQEQRKIAGLLDGTRSLQEVIYLSRMGTFDTCRLVAELVSLQAAEKVTELSPTRIDAAARSSARRSLSAWLVSSVRTMILIFVIFLALPVVAFGLRSHFSLQYSDPRRGWEPETHLSLGDLRLVNDTERLRVRVELERFQSGSYPASIDELGDPTLGDRWEYVRSGGGYLLMPRMRPE